LDLLAHPDPFVLEEALLAGIAGAQAGDPFAPVLVIVPTRRLAAHVERRIAERHGARLNVHVLQYHALVSRILAREGGDPYRRISSRLLEATLESVLEKMPDEPWSRFVSRRPGALDGLLSSLNDLREAGLTTKQVIDALRAGKREQSLGRIYSAWDEMLGHLAAKHGLADETSRTRRAIDTAPAFASGFRAIFHHGAYELVGINLDLLRALDGETTVTVLLPAQPGTPASAYAERFAERHLLEPGAEIGRADEGPGGLIGSRLPALYDESAEPDPVDSDRVVFRNAQGDRAEIAVATRRALGSVDATNPPWEHAIVARSLAPYAATVQAVAQTTGASWATSARVPLRRHPVVHDLLVLLRVLIEDFPRAATVEVLRSPRIRWEKLDAPRPLGDRAESWSRQAKILKGLRCWTEDLPQWAEESFRKPREADEDDLARFTDSRLSRRKQAEIIGRALEKLKNRLDPKRDLSWREHAERLLTFIDVAMPGAGEDDPGIRDLESILDDMRDLDVIRPSDGRVRFDQMARWLEHSIDRTEIDLQERDEGGVRILDFMQARGLTFNRLWIIGMNERLFPRVPREDPFLPDRARQRLIDATHRPLPLAGEADAEEHLLLSLMLGAARDAVEISWQRADDTGRSKTPSLALREVARVVNGTPDLADLVEGAARMSSHPRRWLEAMAEQTGMLDAGEERSLVALRGERPDAVLPILTEGELSLRRALTMLASTESFAPGDLGYDARIGRGRFRPDHYSATSLECLGRCPLQYFFRDVLRLRELEDEPSPYQIDVREMGERVHRLLERLYGRLLEEGLLDGSDIEATVARARELLRSSWGEALGGAERRIGQHLPVLAERLVAHWTASLEEFVDDDLRRIADHERTVVALEQFERGDVDLGNDVRAELVGVFDRIADERGLPVVSDYKTRGKLDRRVNITEMLKARTLQVPLYWLLNERAGWVEILGAGPYYDACDTEDRRGRFGGFENARQQEGFLETVRTLVGLVAAGAYPTNPERHCEWCDYRQACRRKHPPTREREVHARDSSDYRDLHKKNKSKKPLLGNVRDDGRPR
jgi:ATP-dependent helicase/nuclease subunit B